MPGQLSLVGVPGADRPPAKAGGKEMNGARIQQTLNLRNWLVEATVLAVFVLISLSAVSGWRAADAANVFPEALSTIPTIKPSAGFKTLTAHSLRQKQPGQHIINIHVDYVQAKARSNGPFVVSVNPIDSSTWAAVALGSDGRCYAELVYQPTPDGLQTYYARLPLHTPCQGQEANRFTVTSTEYPS